MKKERHPVYWAVMTGFILLLVLGVILLICAISVGDPPFLLAPARSV